MKRPEDVLILMVLIGVLMFLLAGCAYNPYQDPNMDWSGVPGLVPLEERKPVDVGKMCLGDVV